MPVMTVRWQVLRNTYFTWESKIEPGKAEEPGGIVWLKEIVQGSTLEFADLTTEELTRYFDSKRAK